MTVEIGLRIKKASPCPLTFIAAMSNGYLHYSPPAEDYAAGGYEVTECLLAPGWQRVYEKKVGELVGRLWKRVQSATLETKTRKPQRAQSSQRRD